MSKTPFEELLQRARAGEVRALEEIFHRSQKALRTWASQHRQSAAPAGDRPSDIAQDVRLLAFSAFPKFRGHTEREWFGWLQEILSNHTKQSHRDAQREKRAPPGLLALDSDEAAEAPSAESSPSQSTAYREHEHWLLVYIYELPDDQRAAITFCHVQDLPVSEAARRMEKTERSVEGLLLRGWEEIRNRMGKLLGRSEEKGAPPVSVREAETAMLAYLRRRSSGEEIAADAFISEYPACADELRDMIHWVERLQALRPRTVQK